MREKKHTREGAVGVRERGIYIYIYIYIKSQWEKGGLLVWDGAADSRTKKEEQRNKRNGIQCSKENIRENVLDGARVLLRVIGWMTHPYTFSEFTLTTPP